MKKSVTLYLSIVLSILILCITIAILIFDYKKAELEKQKEIEISEMKEEQEQERQINLKNCINQAETNRRNLWAANCPENNKNCSLHQNTINWIDSRYEQDIKNCNSLYN